MQLVLLHRIKSIAETVMKWQEVGFRGFKDRGGKNWRIDNYARTVVKTTTRRVYRQMRTQPADELGIDTFTTQRKQLRERLTLLCNITL